MVKRYSDAEIAEMKAFYEEHGVVRLKGLLDAPTVETVLGAIDDAATHADDPVKPGQGLSFGTAPGRMTIRHQWRENPIIRDFLLDPALAEPIARICGAKTLRFWFDLTFMHDGAPDGDEGVGTPWHHDISAFAFKGEKLPSLWMALTPSNAERSRLMFIDRSHVETHGYYRPGTSPQPAPGESDGFLDTPDFDALIAEGKCQMITWDCDPGDAIIIHPYQIHAASGNKGAKGAGRRVAITTRWLGEDCRYLPTHGTAMGKQVPGLGSDPVPIGAKPFGDYFPMVWSEDMAKADA